MQYDMRGLAVTTNKGTAVADLDIATRCILAHRKDAGVHLDRALTIDPGLVIGHGLKGFAQMLLGRGELAAAARGQALAARRGLQARGGTPRERALVQALELWLGGAMEASAAALERSVRACPLDALTFKICYSVYFMLGDVGGMRRAAEAARPAWSASVPDRGFIDGCYAFALEESGELDEAERIGRQAVEIEPQDAWGCHAVIHVFGTRGEAGAGLGWLEGRRRGFPELNNFGRHLAWHEALFRLALNQTDTVLALYDREVRDQPTDDYRDVANAASLLWRLERRGIAVGDRWQELANVAEARLGDSALVFARLHYLLCLKGSGRIRATTDMLDCIRRDARAAAGTQSRILAEVGLPLAEIIANPKRLAAESSFAIAAPLDRIGGSRAQRSTFEMILGDPPWSASCPRAQAQQEA